MSMEWKNYPSDVTIQSPPKLTRIVQLDSSKFLPSNSIKGTQHEWQDGDANEEERLQSQFSLPALAGEVADAQKQQAMELNKRQEVFLELQVTRFRDVENR